MLCIFQRRICSLCTVYGVDNANNNTLYSTWFVFVFIVTIIMGACVLDILVIYKWFVFVSIVTVTGFFHSNFPLSRFVLFQENSSMVFFKSYRYRQFVCFHSYHYRGLFCFHSYRYRGCTSWVYHRMGAHHTRFRRCLRSHQICSRIRTTAEYGR